MMNRKSSISKNMFGIKPKTSFRKGSVQLEPGRKSSVPTIDKPRKSISSLTSLSKVSLGCPQSVAAPLKGTATPKSSKAPHRSLQLPGLGTGNRLSVRASGFGIKCKKVPWEIGDSAFKFRCIDKILDFLISNEYESSITRNTLKSPTAKDFSNIFAFIYQFLDPAFKLTKMEEQIPKLMKLHSFPGQLTKSTFLNVGSPHAWPGVLAMLAWLCDVVKCTINDSVEGFFTKDFETEKSDIESKLNVIMACYEHQEEEFIPLIQEFKIELESIKGISNEDFQRVLESRDYWSYRLEEVPCKEQELAEIKDAYLQLQSDYEKIVEYKEKMYALLNERNEDRDALTSQRDQMKLAAQEIEQDIISLRDYEKSLALSEEKVHQIKNYKRTYLSVKEYYKQEESALKQKQWKEETELSKLRINHWATSVCEFVSKCRQIGLDATFLSDGEQESFNNNKDHAVMQMKTSIGHLVSENVMTSDALNDLEKDVDQNSDRFNGGKKKFAKLEKEEARLMEEKNKQKVEKKVEDERLQAEYDQLSEDIVKARKVPENSWALKLKAITNEYKSLIEKNIDERKEAKIVVSEKRSNVDWFLAKKAEMYATHRENMQEMYENYLEKRENVNLALGL